MQLAFSLQTFWLFIVGWAQVLLRTLILGLLLKCPSVTVSQLNGIQSSHFVYSFSYCNMSKCPSRRRNIYHIGCLVVLYRPNPGLIDCDKETSLMKQQYSSVAGKAIKTRFALFIWKEKRYVKYKINRFFWQRWKQKQVISSGKHVSSINKPNLHSSSLEVQEKHASSRGANWECRKFLGFIDGHSGFSKSVYCIFSLHYVNSSYWLENL